MNPVKRKISDENQSYARDRETRQQILKAAQELFLDRGFNGVSMKDVAEVVQITSAALYYHFPEGKQDLFMSVMQALFEEWTHGAELAVAPAHGIRESLILLTQYLFTLPLDRFALLARDVHEHVLDKAKKRMLVLQSRDAFLQLVTNIFQQAIEAGEITRDIPAGVLATMYEGMSTSVLRSKHLSLGGIENFDAEQLAALVTSVLLDGIAISTGTTS